MNKLLAFMIWLSAAGCSTIPGTHDRKGEAVRVAVVNPSLPDGSRDWKTDLAKSTASFVLKYVAGKYEAGWGGGARGVQMADATNGLLVVDKLIVVERDTDSGAAATMVIACEPVLEGSGRSFFVMRPVSVDVQRTSAKATRFAKGLLKADTVNMTVDVVIRFPDARQKDNFSMCSFSFSEAGVAPGFSKTYENGDGARFFEVPSDGPVDLTVRVKESNSKLSGWLGKGLKALD